MTEPKPIDQLREFVKATTGADLDPLWQKVRENHAKLDGCLAHLFEPERPGQPQIGGRFVCSRCGGSVDSHAKHWYEKGMADARERLAKLGLEGE